MSSDNGILQNASEKQADSHDSRIGSHARLPELNRAYQGNCLEVMKDWPEGFVDSTVTSPPYFALRSYLPECHELKEDEIGDTGNLDNYLERLYRVFAEVWRITRPNGTLWINIGDTYCTPKNKKLCPSGFSPGELLGVPHRLAKEVRLAGWALISEVIWHKPNANPRFSGRYPLPAHEYVFQFARLAAPHYRGIPDFYFDPYAIQERAKYQAEPDRVLMSHARSVWSIPTVSLNGRKLMADFRGHDGVYRQLDPECPFHNSDLNLLPLFHMLPLPTPCTCKPVEADFFAAMPPALAERCILCSTSEVGNCSVCGAAAKRLVIRDRVATRPGLDTKKDPAKKARKDPHRHVTYTTQAGWIGACEHHEAARVKPVVFDPFMGSGTTAVAAEATGRDWLGCELNPVMAHELVPARLKAARKKAGR